MMKNGKSAASVVIVLASIFLVQIFPVPVFSAEDAKSEKQRKAFARDLAGYKGCVDASDRNHYELVTGTRYPKHGTKPGYPRYCEGDTTDVPTW